MNFSSQFGFTLPALNDAGQIAFRGFLTGSGVDFTNEQGIWSEGSGNLTLVARGGNQAAGTPSGVNYGGLFSPVLNNAGQIAFRGTDVGAGIWSEGSGSLALVARAGDHAPGTPSGVNYGSISYPVLNDAGQIAFSAVLVAGSGVDITYQQGVAKSTGAIYGDWVM